MEGRQNKKNKIQNSNFSQQIKKSRKSTDKKNLAS